MVVYIGADHRGVKLKGQIDQVLEEMGMDVVDMGAHNDSKSCDYPKIAQKVATQTVKNNDDRGILICMSGIGQSIAANKVKGARAALCLNDKMAKFSRLHNDANILVLSAQWTPKKDLKKIVKNFLTTKFEGGRHLRRVKQIKRIEQDT